MAKENLIVPIEDDLTLTRKDTSSLEQPQVQKENNDSDESQE